MRYQFAVYYSSPEVTSGFSNLYNNKFGIQDKFVAYWDKIASVYKNNPYIIGYDPLNEPFPGNVYEDESLVYEEGRFDATQLQPLYKKCYDVYQKYDKTKIMFYEPGQFPDTLGVGGGIVFPLGFEGNPGGDNKAN